MNLHKNARTTPHSQLLMVRRVLDQKQPATKVAADFGVSERTVRKWLARWRAGGERVRVLLAAEPDLTITELRHRLAMAGIAASRSGAVGSSPPRG